MLRSNNIVEFAYDFFCKAIDGKYPVPMGTEDIRKAIIEYEGPKRRNSVFDLDNTTFYYEKFDGRSYWLGVCETYDPSAKTINGRIGFTTFRSSPVYANNKYSKSLCAIGNMCIIIPRVCTASDESTLKLVRTASSVLDMIIKGCSTLSFNNHTNYFYLIHLIHYLLKNKYGINMYDTQENFFKVADAIMDGVYQTDSHSLKRMVRMNNGITEESVYEYFKNDAAYVGASSVEFPKYYAILGTQNRFLNYVREANEGTKPDVATGLFMEESKPVTRARRYSYAIDYISRYSVQKVSGVLSKELKDLTIDDVLRIQAALEEAAYGVCHREDALLNPDDADEEGTAMQIYELLMSIETYPEYGTFFTKIESMTGRFFARVAIAEFMGNENLARFDDGNIFIRGGCYRPEKGDVAAIFINFLDNISNVDNVRGFPDKEKIKNAIQNYVHDTLDKPYTPTTESEE